MLQNIQQFYGKKLGAVDGHIGQVKDFYFDDQTWVIRYLAADTGSWLPGRQVLLPSHAFAARAFERAQAADNDLLHVNLTRRQIEESPSIESHRPVSRQYQEAYHRHYGWPFYWRKEAGNDGRATESVAREKPAERADDPHLQSTQTVTGYSVRSIDATVGFLSSFMIHGIDWTIRELIIKGGHGFAGEEISLLPENIDRISYEEAVVFVKLRFEDIRQMVGIAVP
jgi:hypothetical protein